MIKNAKHTKNDEFYTLMPDIERELSFYKDSFKGKTIYCNCDSYNESNFVKYFELQFNELGLKQLISTSIGGVKFTKRQLVNVSRLYKGMAHLIVQNV